MIDPGAVPPRNTCKSHPVLGAAAEAGFFDDVCKKAREVHGRNAALSGYCLSYWRSRLI